MPIDFNSPVIFTLPRPTAMLALQRPLVNEHLQNDTFIKSIDNNTDKNYDGIKIEKKSFGKLKRNGEETFLYTITNKNGASVDLSTYGATITSIRVPDKNGNLVDVTQGYSSVTPYEESPIGHAGGTIGPCANKIDNGKFKINNIEYQLERNKDNGKSHSHGGSAGFDTKNWNPEILKDGIKFTYRKKDMEGGHPGNILTSVTYKLDNKNKLHIKYHAQSDKDTMINLTNHTYFNLDGAENTEENSILNHIVEFPNSSNYTENNELAIPNGKIVPVNNTPFDFRRAKKIGFAIDEDFDQLKIGKGFDQNYCIDNYNGKTMREIARVKSEKTGILLKVATNLPGFQFYTANNLGKISQPEGKNGKKYEKRSAFCIEPQFYPNAINTFNEKPILKKDDIYDREIIYEFGTEN